jgi:antitoxin component HigA of HigAB toxin-antitoxin module
MTTEIQNLDALIIQAIRQRLEDFQWTQARLARELGYKNSVPVGMYLNGKRQFTLNTVERWFKVLRLKLVFEKTGLYISTDVSQKA